ncbi:hypothetical protein [Ideonella sp.]|uniref:hypothetical protein n=1 Tax=Ideonella sp. TaxID=1929293 RepID=UPI0037C10335
MSFFVLAALILSALQYVYYLHVRERYFNLAPETLVISGVFVRTGGPGVGYRTFVNDQPLTCSVSGAFAVLGMSGSKLNCSQIGDEYNGKSVSISYLKTPQWCANDGIGRTVLGIDAEGRNIYRRSVAEARDIWEMLSVAHIILNTLAISFCITSIQFSLKD